MKTYKLLSIDETGKAHYSHPSKVFIVSGVIIPETLKPTITKQVQALKQQYLGDPDVVFHSRDMHRAVAHFTSLKDSKIAAAFWHNFIEILKPKEVSVIFIVVDKQKAKRKGWLTQTVLERTYLALLEEFVAILHSDNDKGKVIIESEPSQDSFLIHAHNRLQSTGTTDKLVKPKDYQRMVTSLSLVNKENLDIDIQIADMLAFVAGVKYEQEVLKVTKKLTDTEKLRLQLLEEKLAEPNATNIYRVLL